MEGQKTKKILGPRLWENLKRKLRAHTDAVVKSSSVRLEFQEHGVNGVEITNLRNGRRAALEYKPDAHCVFYSTPVDRGEFVFRVSADGTVAQFMNRGLPRSAEEIVVVIISHILDD